MRIATDTSTVIDWLQSAAIDRSGVAALVGALRSEQLILPPPVVAELRSNPRSDARLENLLNRIERLPISDGFWDRAGESRARLLALGLKARLADALIAQSCIDADVPLITGDSDFRHFAAHCGLSLAT